MSDVTVKQLADVVGTPVERLLEQLTEAGLKKGGLDDLVSDSEKLELLDYLRRAHGKDDDDAATGTRKITLRRKSVSELRVSAGAPGRKTVNVEVRGKRTYVKRTSTALQDEAKRKQELEEERAQQDKEAREQEQRRVEAETAKRNEEAERKAKEEAEAKRKLEEADAKAKREKETRETPAKKEEPKAKTEANATTKSKSKRRKDSASNNKDTRYGRDELHVAKGKAGRRKPKQRLPTHTRGRQTESKHAFELPSAPVVRDIKIGDTISVAELANAMAIKAAEVIKSMMRMGVMATINQVIDQDTAVLVVEEMGHKAVAVTESDIEKNMTDGIIAEVDDSAMQTRPPVVTVMGHVDHGKTSLLDYIRKAKIADGEAGGITQHIGAYRVPTVKGSVTFLDTPGHAAFTSMRARGAQCTDIVILVVAADDGVMPQTKEAIQHSRAAGVPMIVAVNKIDKPEADPERVRNELSQFEVIPEAWGGDTMFINVSALSGEGVDKLLEACLLQAEILELKATPSGTAQGVVIEASLDKGRGPMATVLVQSGTLRQGDMVVAGTELGRVRALFDETGKAISSAGPSTPAVILGLSSTPLAGDEMLVAADERKAKELVTFRQNKVRDLRLASSKPSKLEDVFSQVQAGQLKSVNLLVKTDVQGSYEAIKEAMEKLTNDEVQVKIVGGGVGGITESDVHLANASSALLIGFNVRADGTARRLVQELSITPHYYSVIYEAIDQVKAAVNGLLAPEIQERIIGLAEVKDVFKSPKFGAVAGCMVIEGTVRRSQPIRVLRDSVVIYEGELESLRRFKDDVNDVRMGTECGIAVKNYNDVKPGDQIEVFERTEVARTI